MATPTIYYTTTTLDSDFSILYTVYHFNSLVQQAGRQLRAGPHKLRTVVTVMSARRKGRQTEDAHPENMNALDRSDTVLYSGFRTRAHALPMR